MAIVGPEEERASTKEPLETQDFSFVTLNHHVSLLAPHVGHTESKDSSCTFHLFLRHQVGKMLPAAVPRTSTPSAMSPVQTSGEV